MKSTHRSDLFLWSRFDDARNMDFHSLLWVGPDANVAVDPLPLSAHDGRHVEALGGIDVIVVTNADHVRHAEALAGGFEAAVVGPLAERQGFPIDCDRWVGDQDEIVPGLRALVVEGSKTAGELALLLDPDTLITGDLVRGHRGGRLNLLPDPKLSDKAAALASVRRLTEIDGIEAVLVGDGWPVFRDGAARLRELLAEIEAEQAS